MSRRAAFVLRRPPIRVRLALWSTAGLLVVLAVAGFAMRVGFRYGLRERAHESLEVPFRVVEHHLATESDLQLHDLLSVPAPSAEQPNELIGQLLGPNGEVLDSTGEEAARQPMVGSQELRAAVRDGEWHDPRTLPGRSTDDLVVVVPILSGARAGDFVVLAQTLAPTDAEVDRLTRLYLILAPILLVTSFVGGWWIARASLRPVDELTRRAAVIDPEVSDTTLPVPAGDDEISRLARALNDMLERLRHEIDRQRRFSADASHELRTPLALMAASLDVSMRSASTPAAARPVLESLREDVARLSRIVEDLLFLSRAEAKGHVDLARTDVDLLDLVVNVAARFKKAAASEDVTIGVDGTPVVARVDEHLLMQAVTNLVDNALKFSAAGAGVRIVVAVDRDGTPTVSVEDEGSGIPDADLDRVFERFYQVDAARATGGSGLGLAIVRSIVEAHGGTIDVESELGRGTRFTIRLPADVVVTPRELSYPRP